ncbi:MAG: hypothetical protein JWP02_3566 [Acidimicrobiales bacterium]|nr:hypothetical protein [Acidimicrobiales bacterium]
MSATSMYDALEPKQRRFVDEFVVDWNATQAAIRAGYSKKTAAAIGSENLTKPAIQSAIKERTDRVTESAGLTAKRVVEELARVAFSDMRRFTTWSPGTGVTLIDSATLSDDDARCVAEVSETTSQHGSSLKFKLHDKIGPLKELAERMGIDRELMQRLYPELDAESRKQRVLTLLKGAKDRAQAGGA